MDIKKVDEKPMVIHTKEKSKLHAKGRSELKVKGRQKKDPEIRQGVKRENRMYAGYRKAKAGKGTTVKKKSPVSGTIASVTAKVALDELDGGNEVYNAYTTAQILTKPAVNAVDAGRNLYRLQAFKAKQKNIKKKREDIKKRQSGSQINRLSES